MQQLDLFDASAWLGKSQAFPLMDAGTSEGLREIFADSSINGALISHWLGSADCSHEGNQRLLDDLEGMPGCYATIALNPPYPADPDSPGTPGWEWPSRVRAVRVFPSSCKYPLTPWCMGSLCEMLLERNLPIFVFHSEVDFRDLYQLASACPDLNIVVESQPKKIMYDVRSILPLMRECRNVRLEMSNLCTQGMIEYVVNTLGPERLVFGTFAPANDPLVPIGMILQADISQEARQLIAGENMRRMIREVRL